MKHPNQSEKTGKSRVCVLSDSVFDSYRLNQYFSDNKDFDLIIAEQLPLPPMWDIAVVPASNTAVWIPIIRFHHMILFGPGSLTGEALCAGAADYIKDPWTPEELYYRLLKINGNLNPCTNPILPACLYNILNYQERILLEYLLSKKDMVVSRGQLQLHLWGRIRPGSRGVDMHISNVRKKLHNCPEAQNIFSIETVNGCGYLVHNCENSQCL
ncbi:MAG: response regulator transcription factor [Spirochaetales bacterium]|nr:response regulator transcription factor [Spirochaetales bacterium]